MRLKMVSLTVLPILIISLACQLPFSPRRPADDDNDAALPALAEDPQPPASPGGPVAEDTHSTSVSGITPERALSPDNLVYLGAFRLPDDSGGMGWDYSGHGLTHFPGGNPAGRADGLPGSLFMVGHDHQLQVAEISIPHPVISKHLEDLNTAETLQPLADITGGMISDDLQIPRMGIEYLPAQPGQTGDQIHFAMGQHFQGFEPSHGWVSLDLANPVTAGLWLFDGFTNYATNDYLFEIPATWADQYLNGYRLATGRFREGVWSGFGPALFAYAPWEDGNPPAPGSTLRAITPLLLYGYQADGMPEIVTDDAQRMNGYAESDHWWGGAWLTADAGNAVIFTGTKALGKSCYGFANGVVWDYACAEDPEIDCPAVPEFPFDNRGYWAEDYQPAILFFNPEDLARVAVGEAETYDPQPYALMDLTSYWFDPQIRLERYKRDLVGAAAFDRENGLLYIVERLADADKSVIHVFRITD